jgi:hypothetical protein
MPSPLKEAIRNDPLEKDTLKMSSNNGYIRTPQENGGGDDANGVLLEEVTAPKSTVVHFVPSGGTKTQAVLSSRDPTTQNITWAKRLKSTKLWASIALLLLVLSIILASTLLQISYRSCDDARSPQGKSFLHCPHWFCFA